MSGPGLRNLTDRVDAMGVAVCVLLTALIAWIGFRPVVERQARLHTQRVELTSLVNEAETLSHSFSRMRQQYKQTEQQIQQHALRLESSEALNRRLAQLTAVADRCGLQVDRIDPGRGIESRHYVKIPIQIQGVGSYGQANRFLQLVYEQMPDVALHGLQLRGQPAAEAPRPTFRFDLHWYAAPDA